METIETLLDEMEGWPLTRRTWEGTKKKKKNGKAEGKNQVKVSRKKSRKRAGTYITNDRAGGGESRLHKAFSFTFNSTYTDLATLDAFTTARAP